MYRAPPQPQDATAPGQAGPEVFSPFQTVRDFGVEPNTGEKDWVYNDSYVGKNDRWRHSMWLEFLYQRLLIARELLANDGVILVSINDENRARLELMMDEVFPGRRIGSFVWRTRMGSMDAKRGYSADHEHVLAYAKERFEFVGNERDESKYSNQDNDPRGPWGNQMLIQSKNAKDRPEAYYPIHNPETNTWYLCDPDSVWRFSSKKRPLKKKKLQADPMEDIIEQKRIIWPPNEQTVVYNDMAALLAAIKNGSAPKEFRIYSQIKGLEKLAAKNEKVARLLTYIEPLEFWVGKKLGFGRPRYKRFLEDLRRDAKPLSSWLQFSADTEDDDAFDDSVVLSTGGTSEGTSLLREIMGNKDFPYPKPLSLVKGLLSQATRKNDIVLDFFAGSGTTGQAVLELNAEDGKERRFILCSSTEATTKEPEKNICRDITAERMRRIIQGYAGKPGYSADQGGEFAYLQLDKLAPPDVPFEAKPENAMALLSLRLAHAVWETQGGAVQHIARADNCDILLCTEVNAQTLEEIASWPGAHGVQRLAVYCERPLSLQEALEARGIEVNCHSLTEALLSGQAGARA
ncbi:site-specific DNA-methyltransferase [Stenotrophomonas acidaminiphila]|uniref:site-specific DNA-methyltransferase n=1 Tax=Stenotrophomonas acidaminiphila TaxID=128780 RepID=UPI002ABE52C4|nr:site-specific DNA-methyltransferase [Stenotrophomonas acidaminiphila]WPU57690.1 site-specific DNA-methyltransferase [Stenotrophomonas acidaminiphila]